MNVNNMNNMNNDNDNDNDNDDVLTSPHRLKYNAVRRHRTGSDNSGAEDYLRTETI